MPADIKNAHIIDVLVLGAGASGLMCAMTAGQRGRKVLVLEKANKVGKKILMSGGGRCNFTNHFVEASNFLSHNPHFCKSALKRYTQWDFISMVERYGIAYEERKHSQLFCRDSAKDILAMLLDECRNAGVDIQAKKEIKTVSLLSPDEIQRLPKMNLDNNTSRYAVVLEQESGNKTIVCSSLVVATGALSIPTLGGSGYGYQLAEQFGLTLRERRAGLVPFMFSDATKKLCETLAGVSLDARVRCGNQSFQESILFTHRGISGPAMLQISNYWHPGETLEVDLLPSEDVEAWLIAAKASQTKSLLRSVLVAKLPKALVLALQSLWWEAYADKPLADIPDKKLIEIAKQLSAWPLKPSATEGYRTAEVTLGGVDTADISSKTMEVKQQPGLFFIGEVLDVTGHLGGFNFQWAWSSGYAAGQFV